MQLGRSLMFQENKSPSSGSKIKPSKKPALLDSCLLLIYYMGHSSTLKMEVMFFSRASDFSRIT
jgi:hypothetical protein